MAVKHKIKAIEIMAGMGDILLKGNDNSPSYSTLYDFELNTSAMSNTVKLHKSLLEIHAVKPSPMTETVVISVGLDEIKE